MTDLLSAFPIPNKGSPGAHRVTVTSVKIELLTRVILQVTYSQYIQELSMSVTSVNIELLHRVILYVTYSQYMKELSMSVASVIMKLLGRILLLGI